MSNSSCVAVVLAGAVAVAVALAGSSCGEPPIQPSNQKPPALKVTMVQPATGAVNTATDIQIFGTSFKPGATVTLGGIATQAVVVSATVITATAPARASGAIDVVVTNTDGETSTLVNGFRYVSPLKALEISGNVEFTSVGETSQITATATFEDGTSADVTREARWSTALSAVATVSPQGLVTARGLGVSTIFLQYPTVIPSLFRSVRATVTPAGTFAVSGRTREPGEGAIGGVKILNIQSGLSVLSSGDGSFATGGLTDARFSFTKDGYEDVERAVTPGSNEDVPMQRILRVAAGDAPLTKTLAPNDLDYLVAGGAHCRPCRMIRVTSETSGLVQIRLTWTPNTALHVWAAGQQFAGNAAARELTADVDIGAGDLLVFVGQIAPGSGEYLPFTITVAKR